MSFRFTEFATRYIKSDYHQTAIITSGISGLFGWFSSDGNNQSEKACGYALGGYFYPITVSIIGTKYFLNKKLN